MTNTDVEKGLPFIKGLVEQGTRIQANWSQKPVITVAQGSKVIDGNNFIQFDSKYLYHIGRNFAEITLCINSAINGKILHYIVLTQVTYVVELQLCNKKLYVGCINQTHQSGKLI